MATRKSTQFEAYEFDNEEEYRSACSLTVAQRQFIQTEIAKVAQSQINALPTDMDKMHDEEFMRKIYYNKGAMDAYQYLLICSEDANSTPQSL